MKKILVALATAALTFTGLASPAQAATIDASNASQYVSISINANNDQLTLRCLNGGYFAHPSGGQFNVWTVVDTVNGWNITQSPRASININQAGDLILPLPTALDPTVAQSLEIRDQDTYCTDGSTYSHDFAWGASLAISFVPPTQTVTFDANTGSGSITASVANGARTLSDGTGFAKPGYRFTGWNTAANGTGTAIAASASYTPSGNVTLYAQWTRIPTPPAPVFTSPIAVAGNGGLLSLNGSNLAGVTSVTVDDQPATISTASNGQVTVSLPTLAPGKYDITLKNADGAIRFVDGLIVPDPNAKVAEKPTTTYVAASAIKVSGSTPTAKQAAALTAFVAQYKNAKQATVYIRTSKAGLTAAKKAAAAMLATVTKTLKGVKTGIVVDSTNEKATSLDLVVND